MADERLRQQITRLNRVPFEIVVDRIVLDDTERLAIPAEDRRIFNTEDPVTPFIVFQHNTKQYWYLPFGTTDDDWQLVPFPTGVIGEPVPLPNEIISTMGVVWSGVGYVFQALYTRYRFDQQIWLANGGVTQEITLAAADPDNNRFDTFYVNNAGEWGVLQGDAAVDPIVKMPDPAIGLYVTHVLVTANTIEPPDLPQGLIYDEAAVGEWTASNVGGTLDDEATTDPEHGTYHIAWTSLQNGNTLSLAKGSTENLATYETLRLGIQLLAGMLNKPGLFVSFWLAGVQNSTEVQVPMAKNSVGSWQIIAMALSAFTFNTSTPQADTIRFRWYKGGQADTHAGIYLDYIKLEGGIVPPVITTSVELTGEVLASGQTGTPFPSIINEGTASETLADADTFLVRISTVLRKISWGSIKTLIGTLISGAITAFSESLGEMAWEDDATADGKTYGRKDGAWAEVEAGGGGGHTIIDPDGDPLTQRDDLQITGGADVTDDPVNERTVIAVHARQHSILSTDDHQADVANAGKILGFAETTGEPTAFETEEYEGTRNHYVQNTVPTIASAAEGDTWTNPDTARSFELFVDGALKYWIEITPNKITT